MVSIQDIYGVIRATKFTNGYVTKDLKPESRIVADLGADSLDAMELAMACEERFNISVSDEEIQKVDSIADLYDLVLAKQKEAA